MRVAANIKNKKDVHTLEDWGKKYVKDPEADYVNTWDSADLFYETSVLWAQIAIISRQWNECPTPNESAQIIQTLDHMFNEYTYTRLILDGTSKLVLTIVGKAGAGDNYTIYICFEGEYDVYVRHLKDMGIAEHELNKVI